LWSYITKYEPNYYGKVGFISPKTLKKKEKEINVGTLEGIAAKFQEGKEEDKILIDLEAMGFTKLLGTGRITKSLVVKVPSCSKSAAEKVKKAGGQILTETQETGE
jgi:large subunit ribosomal protein L15